MKKIVLALLFFTFLLNSEAQICHTVTINSSSVLCNGNATGSATANVVGGIMPYSYTWSPSGGNSNVATGLTAGVYSVTVADGGTCTVTRTVNITQPNFLMAVISKTNIICYDGVNFGTASVQTIGGTPPMSYTWSPFGGNGPVENGLGPGTYTCFVRDANNCPTSETVTITGPSFSLTATTAQTNNLCGTANGRGSAIVSGGTMPYTYTWSPTGGNSATSSTLTSGIYTVFVKDANNCATSRTLNILQSSQFTLSSNVTNVTCNGAANGSATVSLSGGTPGYTYTWSPTGGNAATTSALGAGIYTLSATDSYSCTGSITLSIVQPAPLTSSATQTNILCNGGSGSGSVSAAGGNLPYSYTWTPSGGNGALATGLTAGNYTVSVTDASLCATSKTYTFNQPPALVAVVSKTNIICGGLSTGAANVAASGGTGAYTYTWSPSGGNSSSASNLAAGTYTIAVKDANNCINSQTLGITSPLPITGSVSSSPANCNNPDGSATVTASGGTGALTYSWIPSGGNAATAAAINAGQYTCTVRDANNCTLNLQTTVSVINPSITLGTSNTSICAGVIATLTASGGASYTWTPAATLSQSTGSMVSASPSVSTVYTVTGSSVFGCTDTETLAVNVLAYPSLSLSINGPDLCTGTVANLIAQGALNYTWNPSTGLNNSLIANPTTTLNSPVIYTVTGSNALGCTGTDTISISPLATPVLTVSSSSSSAAVCSSETITLTAVGASSYSWNVGGSTSSIQLSFPASTVVSVVGTATNGCTDTATLQVNIIPMPVVAIQGSTIVCKGATTILTATGAATYSWSNGTSGSSTPVTPTANTIYTVVGFDPSGCKSTASMQLFIYMTPTVVISGNSEVCRGEKTILTATGGDTYTWSTGDQGATVTYAFNSNTVVTASSSTGNCAPGTGSFSVKINALPTLSLPITSTVINSGQSIQINAISNGTQYSWSPAGELSCSKCSNPVAKPSANTVYTVEVKNENGCRRTETVSIEVNNSCTEPFTPTAFSPDEDGNNDTWCIYGNCIASVTCEIFNRWGQKVFTINSVNQCWDGKINDTPQSAGVFIFQAKVVLTNGETKLLKGNFTLVK